MSLSKEDSRFWSLAEKYGIIEVSPAKNLATVNAAEVPVKVNLLCALLNNFQLMNPT
jgi:hypothetical protein